MIRGEQILESFSALLTYKQGDRQATAARVASPETSSPDCILFIADESHLQAAKHSSCAIAVVNAKLAEQAAQLNNQLLLLSSNPQLAMALVGKKFFPQDIQRQAWWEGPAIHSTAIVARTAQVGARVVIGPYSVIGPGVKIADDCVIGSQSTIEANCSLGARSHIHSQVFIAHGTQIGADCEVHPQTSIGTEGFGYAYEKDGRPHRITHYGRVVIEDRVHIGAGVQIDRGTFADSVIGHDTIIDNHSHFGHNIRIGHNTVIAGGCITAGSVTIGNRCVIGGRTTIAGHLHIADGSQIAGLSGVPNDVEKGGAYGGYPLQPLKSSLKSYACLPHLPRMRKNLAQVMKHLGLSEDPS